MTTNQEGPRLWPAILILAMMGAGRLWSMLDPTQFFLGLLVAPLLANLFLVLWWLFASGGVPLLHRITVVLALMVTFAATAFVSAETFNAFGLILYALPLTACVWVGWLVVSFFLPWPVRHAILLVGIVASIGIFNMLRFDGTDGEFNADINWRWTPTIEAKTLSKLQSIEGKKQADIAAVTVNLQPGDWPAFRGPARDGVVPNTRIARDWSNNPPKLVWKRPVGPGWSSMTIVGEALFTQEQRDQEEVVLCYRASNGEEIWRHADPERFTEAVAGPGPRATPTFHNGRIFAQGAKGRLNCLDAGTGKRIWSRDVAADAGAKVPQWGFSSSPLVVQGVVTVFAGGEDGEKGVIGYNADTGEIAWVAGEGKHSYASTHHATLAGIEQILITSNHGVTSFEPKSGKILWTHAWPTSEFARIVQPVLLGDADLLVGTGMMLGTRRLHLEKNGDVLAAKEMWTTSKFKPYYNDLVVHEKHLYGFDGAFFIAAKLEDGKTTWRERGYGAGQVLLLRDQGLLLILTEKGEIALLNANPNQHEELARIDGIEGKTWNHPVLVRGRLYVRNGQEMACFEMPTQD